MRVSDSRSSISRRMRAGLHAHDVEEFLARRARRPWRGLCSVSMKPETAASGVRSSWLALATKSARASSARLIAVRSCSSTAVQLRRLFRARDIGLDSDARRARERKTRPIPARPSAPCARCACQTCGVRSTADTCLFCVSTPTTARIAVLAKMTRPERSTSINGSGSRSNTSRASAGRPKAGLVLAAVTWSSSSRRLDPRKRASAKQSAAANSIQGADAGHASATAPARPRPAASQKKALRVPMGFSFC